MPGSDSEFELVVVILDDERQVCVRRWVASGSFEVDERPDARAVWRPVCEEMGNGSWRVEKWSDWASP